MSGLTPPRRHLARLVFTAFLVTLIASRTVVILIMTRRLPDLFLHLGGTHVHHLNYGIFLLSTVAGILLFAQINNALRTVCAIIYGISMALTFDEFGMWLHLGGSYWQRASFDAVITILAVFGLLAFAPSWQRIRRPRFALGALALLLITTAFSLLLVQSLRHAEDKLVPRLRQIEQDSPADNPPLARPSRLTHSSLHASLRLQVEQGPVGLPIERHGDVLVGYFPLTGDLAQPEGRAEPIDGVCRLVPAAETVQAARESQPRSK